MNLGTKIRTALRIAVSANTAIYAVSAAVNGLGFSKLGIIWAVLTVASDLVVSFLTTYYNNDYTVEAAEGTGLTRLKKAMVKGDFNGENFFDFIEEEEQVLEEEDGEAEGKNTEGEE